MDAEQKARILRDGPIGWWRTSAGSADSLGTDEVVFNADGTGLINERSLRTGSKTTAFVWKVAAPGVLALRCPGDEGEGDPEHWWNTPIAFRTQTTDLGDVDVLHEAGSDGFWWLIDPLRWVEEPPAP